MMNEQGMEETIAGGWGKKPAINHRGLIAFANFGIRAASRLLCEKYVYLNSRNWKILNYLI
jgi:hypothetical protein